MNLITKELYLFDDNGTYYSFTSGILPVRFFGKLYSPSTISRGAINQTDNNAKSSVSIEMSLKEPFAFNLISGLPETPLLVTIYRNEAVYWSGRVLGVKANKKSVTMECSTLYTSRQRAGVFASVNLTCRHTLYGEMCQVVKESFKVTVPNMTITSSRINLTGVTQDTDYFTAGIAEINGQKRFIKKHVLGTPTYIDLSRTFYGTQVGTLYLYPGCNLRESTCLTKFNNVLNFGGFSRLPTKNPFGNSGLF